MSIGMMSLLGAIIIIVTKSILYECKVDKMILQKIKHKD
jgi:hypothetical protein